MLPVKVRHVVLAQHRVDFRKQADGLLGESYRLGADPYLCVECEYVAASREREPKRWNAWRFVCGRRHIISRDFRAISVLDPWAGIVSQHCYECLPFRGRRASSRYPLQRIDAWWKPVHGRATPE